MSTFLNFIFFKLGTWLLYHGNVNFFDFPNAKNYELFWTKAIFLNFFSFLNKSKQKQQNPWYISLVLKNKLSDSNSLTSKNPQNVFNVKKTNFKNVDIFVINAGIFWFFPFWHPFSDIEIPNRDMPTFATKTIWHFHGKKLVQKYRILGVREYLNV